MAKRSRLQLVVLVAAAIAGSTGCAAERGDGGGLPVAIYPLPAAAAMRYYSGITSQQRLVVHDAATWATVWHDLSGTVQPPPAVPAIDFGTTVVVVAAMGNEPTGGYAIKIDEVRVNAGNASISVTEDSPGANCSVTQAVSAPADVVIAARFDGDATFVERTTQTACK
ncbi:MAG TPA: protease complex subunit PrcB family protein [Kofleriaceae bacterium]